MCGIVGLFLKTDRLQDRLGALTAGMLESMTGRGPDSAGFAIYGRDGGSATKLTLRARGGAALDEVVARLERSQGTAYGAITRDTHAILIVPDGAEASGPGVAPSQRPRDRRRRVRPPHGDLQWRSAFRPRSSRASTWPP